MHTLLLGLISLGDGSLSKTGLDFVVLLNQGAAWAPVSGTAITHAASLDTESLTDLASLHHGKTVKERVSHLFMRELFWVLGGGDLHPAAASEALNETKEHAVAVEVVGSLHGRIVHSIRGLSVNYILLLVLASCFNWTDSSRHVDGRIVARK